VRRVHHHRMARRLRMPRDAGPAMEESSPAEKVLGSPPLLLGPWSVLSWLWERGQFGMITDSAEIALP
jgi:hypothetical protein